MHVYTRYDVGRFIHVNAILNLFGLNDNKVLDTDV